MLTPAPSVLGLAVGGVAILAVEWRHKEGGAHSTLDTITRSQALAIGLIQCLALWPGISRSGATIIGGLIVGLTRRGSAEFSFLIGVPVFAAAAALEFDKSALLRSHLSSFGLAFLVSFACAIVSVRLLMAWLGTMSFKPFGWYRLALSPLLWVYFRS